MNAPHGLAERTGRAIGWLWSPWLAAAAWARSARALHPRGDVYEATVRACPGRGQALGERLAGNALVRCSGALWKHTMPWFEVLGVAMRFRGAGPPGVEAEACDQDLLFATVRRPWLLGLAPLTTRATDFLRESYFAVSPFHTPEHGRVYFRLRPRAARRARGSRRTKLAEAVQRGEARFVLLARKAWQRGWFEVASVELTAPAPVHGEALRFSPFRTGRGIVPRGFIHALRPGAYAGSQWARR